MLHFKPIDISAQLEDTVRFREDSYICSFGDASRFDAKYYVGWLEAKLKDDPWSAVHVWLDQQLIGQMEFSKFKLDPTVGYINLYYLIPEMRGKGLSSQLDEYAMTFLKEKGFCNAYLSVSPTNSRAIQYYIRMGWVDKGTRSDIPEVNLMEKQIP